MKTKKRLTLTKKQEKDLLLCLKGEPNDLDLKKDQADQIVLNLTKKLSEMYCDDDRFGPASKTFRITVPEDYNHKTQIDDFANSWIVVQSEHDKYHNKPELVGSFDACLTSKNYENATYQLSPGKEYQVKLIPVLSTVSAVDCLDFVKKQGAVLVGAQGLTLVCKTKLEKFLKEYYKKGSCVYSLDEVRALHNNKIPALCFTQDRRFISCPPSLDFYAEEFTEDIIAENFLLCFFER